MTFISKVPHTPALGDSKTDLVPLSFLKQIYYHIRPSPERRRIEAKVTRCALVRLDNLSSLNSFYALKNCLERDIAPLPHSQFDRKLIRTHKCYELFKRLVLDHTGVSEVELRTDHLFWDTYAEAQIASLAGIDIKRNSKGTSGNYILRNLAKERVAIFKPSSESPHGPYNPHWKIWIRELIQKIIRMFSWVLFSNKRCIVEEKGAAAEEMASRINEILGFNVVPTTRQVSFYSQGVKSPVKVQSGSMQLFIKDAVDGYAHFGIYEFLPVAISKLFLPVGRAETQEKISEENFFMYALIQILLCNVDGHIGNMLCTKVDDPSSKVKFHIWGVDNFYGNPISKPTHYLDTRGLHPWTRLFWADLPIPPKAKDLALKHKDSMLKMFTKVYGVDPTSRAIGSCFEDRLDNFINTLTRNPKITWAEFANA